VNNAGEVKGGDDKGGTDTGDNYRGDDVGSANAGDDAIEVIAGGACVGGVSTGGGRHRPYSGRTHSGGDSHRRRAAGHQQCLCKWGRALHSLRGDCVWTWWCVASALACPGAL
jgi:hypothetical protein